jgi:adenylate cyclase
MAARQRRTWVASGCRTDGRAQAVGPESTDFCQPCGWRLRHGARFCDGCGVRLYLGTGQAECKHATVMFADVVGSMQIAAALGPERYWAVIVEVVDRCVTVVHRYGGAMDKFTGDGIMAVFRGPVALEEQAFRACLAALEIQAEVERFADEVERADGISLRLRVGLNSGQVMFGEVGPAVGYTAIGEHVGFAQRMESVAPSGGVMLSESTARLVDGAAALGAREFVRVKGVESPLPAWRLLAVEPARAAS